MATTQTLLQVKDLDVQFQTNDGPVYAVNQLNFELGRGETLGIVGESGSGKSQTVLAMMGLLAKNGKASGQVLYQGQDLLTMPAQHLNKIRGNRVAMIFQDPMTSLNPYLTVERQMTEVLIADEPTTALDVTVQAQILALLRDLQRDFGTAIVLITHDLGVVAGICDRVMVMYGGRGMEYAQANDIFYQPSHPYTIGLLGALPRLNSDNAELLSIPGNPPNMNNLPKGCPFSPRCQVAIDRCSTELPTLISASHQANVMRACHRPIDELTTPVAQELSHV